MTVRGVNIKKYLAIHKKVSNKIEYLSPRRSVLLTDNILRFLKFELRIGQILTPAEHRLANGSSCLDVPSWTMGVCEERSF